MAEKNSESIRSWPNEWPNERFFSSSSLSSSSKSNFGFCDARTVCLDVASPHSLASSVSWSSCSARCMVLPSSALPLCERDGRSADEHASANGSRLWQPATRPRCCTVPLPAASLGSTCVALPFLPFAVCADLSAATFSAAVLPAVLHLKAAPFFWLPTALTVSDGPVSQSGAASPISSSSESSRVGASHEMYEFIRESSSSALLAMTSWAASASISQSTSSPTVSMESASGGVGMLVGLSLFA
mmetsp:Transcript_66446/g.97236  ORF Transcript_66446/g.97236 Transcript_66446/m.97236 type:complete len:244 (+) Transcript_66446:441-1172(+)